jgi:hypothetical protein
MTKSQGVLSKVCFSVRANVMEHKRAAMYSRRGRTSKVLVRVCASVLPSSEMPHWSGLAEEMSEIESRATNDCSDVLIRIRVTPN